jgi:hypothetical protein
VREVRIGAGELLHLEDVATLVSVCLNGLRRLSILSVSGPEYAYSHNLDLMLFTEEARIVLAKMV